MKHLLLILTLMSLIFLSSGLSAQEATTPPPPPPAVPQQPTELDFDRQGAPTGGQGLDSDSLLNDLFTDTPGQNPPAQAVPTATPAPPPTPAPAQGAQGGQTLLTPPGMESPVSNPAGAGEAVIERSSGGSPVSGQGSGTVRRPVRRSSSGPTFKNNQEAMWYYSNSAWIPPNQADTLGCKNSYSESYTLLHLRCINALKGFQK
ncbi:MAG: hypothetical protein LBF22_03585 [Deltaproteobacteria bacterium]|nr:hypothetical protein [Deltaproteobacteria bacterium]